MLLSKKKFIFEKKKSENKGSDINRKYNEYKTEINIKNKYSSDKNLFLEKLNITKEKNIQTSDEQKEAAESLILSQNNVNAGNLEEKNFSSNSGLQYLINQNENENIDFINTLLKLKGIQLNQLKNFNSKNDLNNKANISEEKVFTPLRHTEKDLIRNEKNDKSNSSNQTTKINSFNNNQTNENEEEENSKNFGSIIKIKNFNNFKDKRDIDLVKGELLTLSKREKNVFTENNSYKKGIKTNRKQECSFEFSKSPKIKNFRNQYNEKINEKLIKRMKDAKVSKTVERLNLSNMIPTIYNDKIMINPKNNKEKEEFKKSFKSSAFIKNKYENSNNTINNVYNNLLN